MWVLWTALDLDTLWLYDPGHVMYHCDISLPSIKKVEYNSNASSMELCEWNGSRAVLLRDESGTS